MHVVRLLDSMATPDGPIADDGPADRSRLAIEKPIRNGGARKASQPRGRGMR
jgi:hypothetical protein